jgi:HK97 family phage prohead protease
MSTIAELRKRVSDKPATVTARVRWEPERRGEAGEDMRLRGMASVFDSTTSIGSFDEQIAPGAFRAAMKRAGTDVRLLWQHDSDAPLARQGNQTLQLNEDAEGLRFEANVVPTSFGKDAVLAVRTGLVDGMSSASPSPATSGRNAAADRSDVSRRSATCWRSAS